MTPTLKKEDLRNFTGTLERFYHPLNRRVFYTPGVRHVATAGGAYWLIDAIASYLTPKHLKPFIDEDARLGEMIFWKLSVSNDRTAVLEATADSPCPPFIRQVIPFTDFPLETIDVWAAFDGNFWTLYLPGEH